MLDFQTLCEIHKSAVHSIKCDSNDERINNASMRFIYFVLYWFIPLVMFTYGALGYVELAIVATFVGTGIAIYTGLFFTLLINIGTKIRAENNNKDKDAENFQKFKKSMKQIANIALYEILLGVIIFSLILVNSLILGFKVPYLKEGIAAVVLFLLGRFLVSLLFMLQRFYYLIRDEISNIM